MTSPFTLLGIINVTPDSFSDGGRFISPDDAVETALDMIEQGADILDVGGESSRPGAVAITNEEEIRRVVPVIAGIRRGHPRVPISIDTHKAAVAAAALDAGATIVNDISAGRDPQMFPLVARMGTQLILMHMQGDPSTMQHAPQYDDVVAEVRDYLRARVAVAEAAGIARQNIWIDPGIGFGKTTEQNLQLLRNLAALTALQLPVLLGISRKSILGHLLGGRGVTERLEAGLALMAQAAHQGLRHFRVHDPAVTRRFFTAWSAVHS